MREKHSMDNHSIVICDDNKSQAEQLEKMIRDRYNSFDTRICTDVQSLYSCIENHVIDAAFLDIKMNEDDGIEVGKKLRAIRNNIKIIFVSGYPEYIHDIFEVEPSFFLLKPVTEEKLEKAIHIALFKDRKKNHTIEIINRSSIIVLDCEDILYIESYKRTIIVRCTNGESHQTYRKLTELEKILPQEFVRCHQSYIVNLSYVKSLNQDNFILRSEDVIPISQRKAKKTKDNFYIFLKNKH